ncbi:hypothetical protein B0H11DRAFT_2008918 [Mycena galericulata]|nr:hypothetical protein B0H11DRAFT_2008918 [Mycena galericulata]
MLSTKAILSALLIAVSSSSMIAALTPAVLTSTFPNVTFCTGSISPPDGCVDIQAGSDTCVDFTGGLTFLNKEVSNVEIPDGFVCTFFEAFGCLNSTANGDDAAVLPCGTWDMLDVQSINGTQGFNDLASSVSCFSLR